MTSSGEYDFNPGLGELILYAYMNIGIRPTALLQEHMNSAYMATNMMLARWSNQGVNLWKVGVTEIDLVVGEENYAVDPKVVMVLDAYIRSSGPTDRLLTPISRTEYASYPKKLQPGFPSVYWFDRLISPFMTLWPVPDEVTNRRLRYRFVSKIQDANLQNGETVDIPAIWLEAFADGLTYRLARIWNPPMAVALKAQADESYQIAAMQNVEQANTYITPLVGGYWRV